MKKSEFLAEIYANLKAGMAVIKPRKVSKILRITEQGHIYYLIGDSNEKAVTKAELEAVYDELSTSGLTTKRIYEIVGSSKPCNATTIQWILRTLNLATEGPGRIWKRTW